MLLQHPLGVVDDDDAPGTGGARSQQRPQDHRAPADRVQELGQRGAHPGPLARGEDDHGRGGHASHRSIALPGHPFGGGVIGSTPGFGPGRHWVRLPAPEFSPAGAEIHTGAGDPRYAAAPDAHRTARRHRRRPADPRDRGGRGRSRDAARRRARRDAVHRLLGGARDRGGRVRRRGHRRGRRPRHRGRAADPDRGVRACCRLDRARAGVLGLADLLRRRAGHCAQHRRDLGVGRRVRRQGRAGDADRGDPRHPGRCPAREVRAFGARPRRAAGGAADHHGPHAEARQRAAGRRRQAGAAAARRACRSARLVPGAARCAPARRSASATRRATSPRARSAPSPTRTGSACGASVTRSTASAPARCCSRTPMCSGSSTTRSRSRA